MNFDRFVKIAKALQPPYHRRRCFHVTFILRGRKVIKIGINNAKSHPKIKKLNYKRDAPESVHAELDAVLKAGSIDFENHTFINVRLNKAGQLSMSKPCSGCTHLMRQIGFKKFYYSTPNGFEEFH